MDDGTLDSDGRCWSDDRNNMVDCAATQTVDCQYGAEANND